MMVTPLSLRFDLEPAFYAAKRFYERLSDHFFGNFIVRR
jgi:hypothetical protein